MRLHYLTSHSKNGQLEFVVKVNRSGYKYEGELYHVHFLTS